VFNHERWAELNGNYGRCPNCKRRIWVESHCVAECDSCGWSEHEKEDEGRVHDGPQTLADVGMCEDDFR